MEKLLRFIQKLYSDKFFGSVTIKFENGKATHIETTTKRKWEFKDLPE